METEVWLPVAETDGRYEVSNLGRARSWVVGRSKHRPDKPNVLNPSPQTDGYLLVQWHTNGKRVSRLLHNLILEAFVGPRPGSILEWDGCHGDGNPANCRLDNLRWGTRKENMDDRKRHGHTKPERLFEMRGGVKHYRCTACSDWKAEAEFRAIKVPGSKCGRSSTCRVCGRVIDAKNRRDKRAAAKEQA